MTERLELTEAEALDAIPSSDPIDQMNPSTCLICSKRAFPWKFNLKKRFGKAYSQVELECEDGHQKVLVYRLDWLAALNPPGKTP